MRMFEEVFTGFPRTLRSVFSTRNLRWHAIAVALTAVIVLTDTDWHFYEATRSTMLYPLVWAAGIGGFFVPVLLALVPYVAGDFLHNDKLRRAGASVARAVLAALVVTMFYKVFTGRIQPEFLGTIGGSDISKEFQFGVLRNGVFWGWPSSHAATAMAGALAFVSAYRSYAIKIILFTEVALVAAGAAVGFHWFSDVVAGLILGTVVGRETVHSA